LTTSCLPKCGFSCTISVALPSGIVGTDIVELPLYRLACLRETSNDQIGESHISGAFKALERRRSADEWIAILAIASFTYFVVAVSVLQVLRSDYNPMSHFISDYAVGPYGEIMTSAFMSLSLGALCLFVGLVGLGPKTVFFRVSLLFLAVFVPGSFVAALFPTDLDGAPSTTHGMIHDIDATINFISLIAAIVLFSIGFSFDARWRPFRARALLIAVGVVTAFAIMFLIINSHYLLTFGGLANKLLASLLLIWLLATSEQLHSMAKQVDDPEGKRL